jgi:hypothetical protein
MDSLGLLLAAGKCPGGDDFHIRQDPNHTFETEAGGFLGGYGISSGFKFNPDHDIVPAIVPGEDYLVFAAYSGGLLENGIDLSRED